MNRRPKFTNYVALIRGNWYGHYKAVCSNYRGKKVEVTFTDFEIWDAWGDPDNPFFRDAHRIIYSKITKAYHEQNEKQGKKKRRSPSIGI